jgi:hypothetical protein
MAISDTNFISSYHSKLGLIYAENFQQLYNPGTILQTYVTSRQLLLASMSTADVRHGLTIINSHLASESAFQAAAGDIVKSPITSLNSVVNLNYGVMFRDFFNGLANTKLVAWSKAFKEAWYQATSSELVQQIGFATWNGTNLIFYPAHSSTTNIQNTATLAVGAGNTITLQGYTSSVANFAMPGDIIVFSASGVIPSPSTISLSTTVSGYANTNVITLNGLVGVASAGNTVFAFRPLKNPEYLEFRFGTSGVTGFSANQGITTNIVLSVTLVGATTSVPVVVGIGTTNAPGRVNIGTYGNTAFKATGISSIAVVGGNISALGIRTNLEIWVKSIY